MHTTNTLAYLKNIFFFQKIYIVLEFEEKNMFFSIDFIKKNHFLHSWILQYICKSPKGIGQYSKNIKILFLVTHIIHC